MSFSKELLRQVILDQKQLPLPSPIIQREVFPILQEWRHTPFTIILSGVRRSGKSTLLQTDRQHHSPADYYLNFDDDRLIQFTVNDFQVLLELFIELFGEQHTFYFDEIQNIEGWERFIRRLHDYGKKVYITGSNATMLSKELGTHLTGRHLSLTIFPFSFREYLSFHQHQTSIQTLTTTQKGLLKRHFTHYLEDGGFPEYLETKKPDYLKTLYDNIIYRDVVTRYNLPNEKTIKELAHYAASHIGKDLSFNALKNLLNAGSATTIKDYFSYLENTFLLFLLYQYDPSLKKQLGAPKKVYFIDPALSKIIGFRASEDKGRLLENIVFLELKRRKKEIYFHRNKKECDFVIREGTKITEAIQVCAELKNADTQKREYEGLKDAMETYKLKKGLILTEDEEGQEESITIKPIWKWLLEESQ